MDAKLRLCSAILCPEYLKLSRSLQSVKTFNKLIEEEIRMYLFSLHVLHCFALLCFVSLSQSEYLINCKYSGYRHKELLTRADWPCKSTPVALA